MANPNPTPPANRAKTQFKPGNQAGQKAPEEKKKPVSLRLSLSALEDRDYILSQLPKPKGRRKLTATDAIEAALAHYAVHLRQPGA